MTILFMPFHADQPHRETVMQSVVSHTATPATMLISIALFLVTAILASSYYPEIHQARNKCFKRWTVCTHRANGRQYTKV